MQSASLALAQLGRVEMVLAYSLFGLSCLLALWGDAVTPQTSALAAALTVGFAVLTGLRFRLAGALGATALALLLLLFSYGFSPERWDSSRLFYALGLIVLIWGFSVIAGLVVGYHQRGSELHEQGRNLLHKMFDSIPIGVWVRSRAGKTVFVNERWASFSDRSAAQILDDPEEGAPVDLGPGWESELNAIVDGHERAVHYRSIELVDQHETKCSMTLLSLGIFIDSLNEMGTLSLLVDETALRLHEDKVRQSERSLRLALDSARMGFWDEDLESGQTATDANWFHLMGLAYDPGADPLRIREERLHPEDRERISEAHAGFLEHGEGTMRIDYRLRGPGGRYLWVQDCLCVTDRFADGRPRRLMGTTQDITERKQTEAALERARDRAESANEAKSQFIATISHEIRTPLNAIIGMSSFLAESEASEASEETKDLAETIYSSGRSLLFLVNDILDFSKIEAGRLDLEVQEYPLRLLIEDCVKLFRLRAEEKGVELSLDLDSSIPEYALGDMERLRQIIQNLLANALKFTDAGHVTIVVRLKDGASFPEGRAPNRGARIGYLDQAEHDYLEVIVSDTGIGIPSDQQHQLFEAFSQIDASATRRHGGSGLGLVISKRLVHAMGGEIWLESEAGEGATFGFFVRTKPIHRREAPTDAETPAVATDEVERIAENFPCDILVVGPRKSVRAFLRSCRDLGYAPHQTEDYALQHPSFGRRSYNLVFVCLEPNASAGRLIRRLTAQSERQRPDAIIGLTTGGDDLAPERLRISGMERSIGIGAKPGELRELIVQLMSGAG